MFSTSSKKKTPRAADEKPADGKPGKKASPTIISPDLHITGNLVTDGDMQIDGILEGDVKSGFLGVGPSAVVSGEIIADDVIVHGKVTGRIRARSVTLTSSARVIGDIWHEVLSVEAGAFLEGHCKHMKSHDIETAQPAGKSGAKAVSLMRPKNSPHQDGDPGLESSKKEAV